MSQISVNRTDNDGLARQVWTFIAEGGDAGGWALRLVSYGVERRPRAAGRWRAPVVRDLWVYSDERRLVSGLPRPTEIPESVLREAIARARELPPTIYIGFRNANCRYGK